MKRLITISFILLFISLGESGFSQEKKSMDQGYKANYSSNFKMGNPAYSKMILDLWKDWDDNMLDRHDFFSDTIKMYMADGSVIKGKAAVLEGGKKYRASLGTVKSSLHAWVPLHSNDMNEDVVCVWGQEESTYTDGKKEKRELHEVWAFNKAGKITWLRQWSAKPSMGE